MNRTDQLFTQFGRKVCRTSNVRFFAALPAVLFLALIWPFGSGGKKVHMTSGQEDPAAHGVIHITSTGNGNKQLDIQAHALAKPTALTPPAQVYVVWIQRSGEAPTNEGALKVDGNLNGEFKTVTPYKDFRVFITAEKYAQLQAPRGPTVLHAHVEG